MTDDLVLGTGRHNMCRGLWGHPRHDACPGRWPYFAGHDGPPWTACDCDCHRPPEERGELW